MVDSINGPGKRIIITTKPKAKEKIDKKEDSFDKTLKAKAGVSDKSKIVPAKLNPAQNNLKILQQQQLRPLNE